MPLERPIQHINDWRVENLGIISPDRPYTMRIIAGTAGSLPLKVPESLTRPTTDRVREAMFSSLGGRIPEAAVLDLFAGSGSLGIESLSRGARSADFVDSSAPATQIIEENLKKTRLSGGRVHHRDVRAFISAGSRQDAFDLIFADPPYARDEETETRLSELLNSEALSGILKPSGLLVLESFARSPLPESILWEVAKEKIYSNTRVSYLTPAP
tara:strand:- start:724 stop:1365 length:642 start_codon:yes stop_codon:yes gene_type:complete